jgi:hypothetical protein
MFRLACIAANSPGSTKCEGQRSPGRSGSSCRSRRCSRFPPGSTATGIRSAAPGRTDRIRRAVAESRSRPDRECGNFGPIRTRGITPGTAMIRPGPPRATKWFPISRPRSFSLPLCGRLAGAIARGSLSTNCQRSGPGASQSRNSATSSNGGIVDASEITKLYHVPPQRGK